VEFYLSLGGSLLGNFLDQEDLSHSISFDGRVWGGSQRFQAFCLVGFDLFSHENIPDLRVWTSLLRVYNVGIGPHVRVA